MLSLKPMKIFITGIKFKLLFQRLLKNDNKEIGHLPVHWRFVVAGSSVYNDCNQELKNGGYSIGGSAVGDVSSLSREVGVACTNSGAGLNGSILLKRYQCEEHAKIFKDTHGTLQPGYKTSHELELWVPVKKWFSKEQTMGYWNYNIYMSILLELGGSGSKYGGSVLFGGYGGSCTVYYK
jgi:hypothetical protein